MESEPPRARSVDFDSCPDLLLGTVIRRTLSHYRIQEEISRGGMGVVYRALDTKLDREVAVKILPPELMADETRRRRFVLEAKAAAAIHHPHILTEHEADVWVMEIEDSTK